MYAVSLVRLGLSYLAITTYRRRNLIWWLIRYSTVDKSERRKLEMLQESSPPACPDSPLVPKKECLFIKDEDDLRFKICMWCGRVEYRTDEELLKGVK